MSCHEWSGVCHTKKAFMTGGPKGLMTVIPKVIKEGHSKREIADQKIFVADINNMIDVIVDITSTCIFRMTGSLGY